MKRASAIVLQHVACEKSGAVGDALFRHGVAERVVRIDQGMPVPSACDAEALVVMGGPMGVYEVDRYPHISDELRLIEDAMRRRVPVLGICLGSQLIAAALGARVYPGGAKEIGWYDVELTEAATRDLLLGAAPRRFTAFVWHGDVFDLPRGAVHLASSQMTTNQAFRYGEHVYGLLFHLEVTGEQIDAMLSDFAAELTGAGIADQPIRTDTPSYLGPLRDIAAPVFDAFARQVTLPR